MRRPGERGELATGQAGRGQRAVLVVERRPEETGVVRRERHGDAGGQKTADPGGDVADRREGACGDIGGGADVENDAAGRQPAH